MRELTRERVWHLVQAAHSVDQIVEAERVARKWHEEHPEDDRFLREALAALEEKRRGAEEADE